MSLVHSTDQNKAVICTYFEASNRGDFATCAALINAEKFRLCCRARAPIGYEVDYAGLLTMWGNVRDTLTGPLQVTIEQMTAEQDRVSVQAHSSGPLVGGGTYDNVYNFLFVVNDGKIDRIDEYLCSATMAKLLDHSIWESVAQ